jgi:hypothetical protein
MKLKLLFPAVLAVAISAFLSAPVFAQGNHADDDVYMNGNSKDKDEYREEKYKEDKYKDGDHKYKEDKYKEERESDDDYYGYNDREKEKYKGEDYKYKEDKDKYKRDKDYDDDYGYSRKEKDRYQGDDEGYICRRGHHYKCRHDRHGRPRTYYYPGGSVTIGTGKHGFVSGRVWVPGHWDYAEDGRRYWVSGHYKYDKVNW